MIWVIMGSPTDEEVMEALKKVGLLDSMAELVRPSLTSV